MRLRVVLLLAVAVTFALDLNGQPPLSLTLREAVDAALRSQPLSRSADLNVDLADERVAEARSARLPTVRIFETVTRSNNPVFVFGSLLEQSRFGPQNFALDSLNNPAPITNVRTGFAVNVPAFDGLRTNARVAQAELGRDQASLEKRFTEQRIRFDTIKSYFDVAVAQAAKQVADDAVRTAEADVRRARDRFDAGMAVQSDLLNAEVQLAEFRQQQILADGNLATAFAVLNVTVGAPSKSHPQLGTGLVARKFEVADPEELITLALRHRPDYAQSESAIHSAEHRVSERRADFLPEVNVFGSMGVSGRNMTTGSSDYTFGAGLSFNLLDPGRTARLAQSRSEESLAFTNRNRLQNEIVVDVTRAFNAYRAAEQKVNVAEAAVSQATESLRTIQDRYEAGLTTITDVLSAETALVRARMNVAGSRHAHYVGYAGVLLATGELDDVSAFQ